MKIKVTQIRSKIGSSLTQKRTLEALGLKRNYHTIEVEATPQILGMIRKVNHLVNIEELK
jgi:large subunit ribosomal protein L30